MLAVPIKRFGKAIRNSVRGVITEQTRRFGNVRLGMAHITGPESLVNRPACAPPQYMVARVTRGKRRLCVVELNLSLLPLGA